MRIPRKRECEKYLPYLSHRLVYSIHAGILVKIFPVLIFFRRGIKRGVSLEFNAQKARKTKEKKIVTIVNGLFKK